MKILKYMNIFCKYVKIINVELRVMTRARENRFRNYWYTEKIAHRELRVCKEKQVINKTLKYGNVSRLNRETRVS